MKEPLPTRPCGGDEPHGPHIHRANAIRYAGIRFELGWRDGVVQTEPVRVTCMCPGERA
jgi:hypothetical protein